MRRPPVALLLAFLALAPVLAPALPAETQDSSSGRAEPAPPWAVGTRWKWVADQALDFCTTVGPATIHITRVYGSMQDNVSEVSVLNGTEVYRVDGLYSETLTGTLTVMGIPTPINWPVTGNGTFFYRIPDLALVYSYQHVVIDMGSLIGKFTADTSTSASPPVEHYRFPLAVGNAWDIRSDLTVWTKTSGAAGAFETTSNDRVDLDATVPRTEYAVVPAGTLACLNLTYNGTYTTGGGSPQPQNGSALYSPKATNLVFRDFSPLAGLSVVFALLEYSLNSAPAVASPVPQVSFPEDTAGGLDLYSVFSDPDAGDRLGFSAGLTQNLTTTVDNSTGYAVFTPPANWSGSERVLFTATDGKGARARAEVNVTVTPGNDAPVLVRPLPGIIMDEDTVNDTLNLTEHFDDADFPYGDRLSLSFDDNGSVGASISPSGVVTLRPLENWSGVQDITFTATDEQGASAAGLLKVAVLNTPDAPVAVATGHELSTSEDIPLVADLSGRFFDADMPYGDSLTFSVEDVTTGFDLRLDDRTGVMNLTTPEDWSGVTSLVFLAEDSTGRNASERVKVTVTPVNDAPKVVNISPVNDSVIMSENTSTVFRVTVEDIDSPTLNMTWLVDGERVSTTNNITYFADYKSAGPHNVTLTVSDGEYSFVRTWNITVTNVNRPPQGPGILSPANGTKFQHGGKVNFTGAATDPDGDALSFTWKDTNGKVLGTGRAFETRTLSKGKHVVTLEVSDGNATASTSVTLSVSPPPEARTPGFGIFSLLLGGALSALAARKARRGRRDEAAPGKSDFNRKD